MGVREALIMRTTSSQTTETLGANTAGARLEDILCALRPQVEDLQDSRMLFLLQELIVLAESHGLCAREGAAAAGSTAGKEQTLLAVGRATASASGIGTNTLHPSQPHSLSRPEWPRLD